MPARGDAKSLNLTADERVRLESIAGSPALPVALKRRAEIILLDEQGLSDRETARRLRVSHPTVGLWRRRFAVARLSGLRDALRPGRPRIHDDKHIARLLATVLNAEPAEGARWSLRALGKATRMSKTTVGRYLRLYGVQTHCSSGVMFSDQNSASPPTHNQEGEQ
jgi:transposase